MDECDPRLGEGLCRAVCNVSRQIQLNPPPSLTERCKNGILILPKAKATQKYAQFKRSRPTDDTIFAPTRQGRSAPPTAVAGAAASALQSKNIRSLPINCPFYRKFLTEPTRFFTCFVCAFAHLCAACYRYDTFAHADTDFRVSALLCFMWYSLPVYPDVRSAVSPA